MRVKVDWRQNSKENFKIFTKSFPQYKITYKEFDEIIRTFNGMCREYCLETGNKVRLPAGMGDIGINKKKRKKTVTVNNKEHISLPIDWIKTRETGKTIYNFNHHTEGYYYGWIWWKEHAHFEGAALFRYKSSRVSSRMIAQRIKSHPKYHNLVYKEWTTKQTSSHLK